MDNMTNKQYNGFIRFVLDDISELEDLINEDLDKGTIIKKLEKIKRNLQVTLED